MLCTIASQGHGVEEALEQIEAHVAHLETTAARGSPPPAGRSGLHDVLRSRLWLEFRAGVPEPQWRQFVERLAAGDLTPPLPRMR